MAANFTSPGTAYAWTEASVHSVRAHIELQPNGSAVVTYELTVAVHAGWVEGLEIAGLDRDFELLDTVPVSWVSVDGEQKFSPLTHRRRRDRLFLSFRRSTSPRRGQYRVRFAYQAQLGARDIITTESGRVQVTWTLPGWSSGLDGVWITLRAPPGAAEVSPEGTTTGARAEVWQNQHQTLFRWHRAHLPRTMDWTVAIEVPPGHMNAELFRPTRAKREAPEAESLPTPLPSPFPVIALGLFGVLVILRRYCFARACRTRGCQPRPLIPTGHELVRAALVMATLSVACWLPAS